MQQILEIVTFVNQETQQIGFVEVIYIPVTDSGMGSSACDSEGSCCEGTQSPRWFSVQLPAPTTDMIEVSICCDQGTTDEDTPVELIEIYVQ